MKNAVSVPGETGSMVTGAENGERGSELTPIPEGYDAPAGQQGTLAELWYACFESRTYEQKTQLIRIISRIETCPMSMEAADFFL